MTAPARCEPPEHLRDRDGWHWLDWPDYGLVCLQWESLLQSFWFGDQWANPKWFYERGYRYLCPAPTPAEIAAQAEREARLVAAADAAAKLFQWYADEHTAAGKTDKAKRNQDAADSLRAALAAYEEQKG